MSSSKRNIITGIVVLGALVTLVWMILTFAGTSMRLFKPRGTVVKFKCDRADGLSEGSPVFFKGVQIGKVTGVHRLDDNENILIEGELDTHPVLPDNLEGIIKAQSQLGNSTQIDLATKGPARGTLDPSREIVLKFVGNSIFPPELSDMVTEANKQKLVQHVDEMIVSLKAQIDKAGKVLDSTHQMMDDPKFRQDITTAMANIRQATERANVIAGNLEKLTTNADGAVTEMRATIAKTDRNLDQLTHKVGDDLDKLGQSFQQFQQITEKINKGKGTAGAFVNDPKLYDEMALTAKQLNVVAASMARLVDQWEHDGVYIKMTK